MSLPGLGLTMDLEAILDYNEKQRQEAEKQQDILLDVTLAKGIKKQVEVSSKQTQEALIAAVGTLVKFLRNHEPNVSVKNQKDFPGSIKTPDVQEVVNALKPIAEGLAKLPTKYPDFPKFPEFPDFPKTLKVDNLEEVKPWLDAISNSLDKLKLDPVIKVAPTPVNIPPVDFAPLIKALEPKPVEEKIDLDDYKAQDLVGDDTFQYVGFVAPDGSWYIIENDVEGSSLRYKFGSKNYKSNWKGHTNHSYKLLNEAIREVQA